VGNAIPGCILLPLLYWATRYSPEEMHGLFHQHPWIGLLVVPFGYAAFHAARYIAPFILVPTRLNLFAPGPRATKQQARFGPRGAAVSYFAWRRLELPLILGFCYIGILTWMEWMQPGMVAAAPNLPRDSAPILFAFPALLLPRLLEEVRQARTLPLSSRQLAYAALTVQSLVSFGLAIALWLFSQALPVPIGAGPLVTLAAISLGVASALSVVRVHLGELGFLLVAALLIAPAILIPLPELPFYLVLPGAVVVALASAHHMATALITNHHLYRTGTTPAPSSADNPGDPSYARNE
jgi:hypothetical protein